MGLSVSPSSARVGGGRDGGGGGGGEVSESGVVLGSLLLPLPLSSRSRLRSLSSRRASGEGVGGTSGPLNSCEKNPDNRFAARCCKVDDVSGIRSSRHGEVGTMP